MTIKTPFRWLMLVVLTGLATSCWNDFDELDYMSANLKQFAFKKQEACEGIEGVRFYIDQLNGLVYNIDSLPFGSMVDYLVPKLLFYSSNGRLSVNDTLLGENKDTLDFTSPLKLTNESADGQYKRSYWITINVHQVDPDSLITTYYPATFPTISAANRVFPLANFAYRAYFADPSTGLAVYESTPTLSSWSALPVSGLSGNISVNSISKFGASWYVIGDDGRLYTSADGLLWSVLPAPMQFVALYGSINRKYITDSNPAYLTGLMVDSLGQYHAVRSPDGLNWETGQVLEADFPVREAAHVLGTTATNVQFLSVMSGKRADDSYSTSVWSTEDGLRWFLVRQQATLPINGLRGNNLVYYDNQLISFGGITSAGQYIDRAYLSKDHGKNWIKAPEKWVFPRLTAGLAYGSLLVERQEDSLVNKDKLFFRYFGGRGADQVNAEVWKAFEYQMIFLRR